jgi:hypothetical protein
MLIDEDPDGAVTAAVALGHLKMLVQMASTRRGARLLTDARFIRTASDRHLHDYGHELEFGCCKPIHDADDDAPRRHQGL